MTPGSMKVARLKFMMTKSVMMPWYSGTAHMFFSKIYHCTHLVGGKNNNIKNLPEQRK